MFTSARDDDDDESACERNCPKHCLCDSALEQSRTLAKSSSSEKVQHFDPRGSRREEKKTLDFLLSEPFHIFH